MRANFVMSGVADGLRRNLLMTIALVLTTAVSLSFVAAAILTGVEIDRFSDQYQGKLNVSIYLCDSTTGDPVHGAPSPIAERTRCRPSCRATHRSSRSRTSVSTRRTGIALKTLDPAEAQFLKLGDLPGVLHREAEEHLRVTTTAVADALRDTTPASTRSRTRTRR